MSLLDTIGDFGTGTYIVTRTLESTLADGIIVPGTSTTFSVQAVIQPATGMQRVVGGRDMLSDEHGQHVNDVRQIYCATELFTRKPGFEPDLIAFEDGIWTIFRVERWDISGITFWRCVCTRQTLGAS